MQDGSLLARMIPACFLKEGKTFQMLMGEMAVDKDPELDSYRACD